MYAYFDNFGQILPSHPSVPAPPQISTLISQNDSIEPQCVCLDLKNLVRHFYAALSNVLI